MKDRLVPIYEGLTFTDAQELADRLDEAGIEAFTGVTDSPVAGLVAGRQSKIVYVRKPEAEAARAIVRTFESGGRVGVRPEDEGIESEAEAMELPTEQRPSADSPSPDIEGGRNERLDANNVRGEAPEVEGLRLEEPGAAERDVRDGRIRGFGADRDVAMTPDVETDEVEDQPIDKLDVSQQLREEETATPSANLRPPSPKGGGKRDTEAKGNAGNNPDAGAKRGGGPKRGSIPGGGSPPGGGGGGGSGGGAISGRTTGKKPSGGGGGSTGRGGRPRKGGGK